MALHEYQKQMYRKVGVIAALIILPVAGFFVGMNYEKQTNNSGTAAGVNRFANGGPRGMRNRAVGTVKSISATSITITQRQNNTDKTYTLTSSTTYKNGTADAQASDIKTGDTVLLTLDPSNTSNVTTVTLNPISMFRGGASGNADGATPTTTDGDAVLQ